MEENSRTILYKEAAWPPIALRTCIGCRRKFPKKTLLRFVCHLDSQLQADNTGKLPGRGAYVCESQACITEAFKSHKRVNSLLRTNLPREIVVQFKAGNF